MMKKFSTLFLAAVLGSAITLGLSRWTDDGQPIVSQTEVQNQLPVKNVSFANTIAAEAPFDFRLAAKKAMPAVVHIRSIHTSQNDITRFDQIPEQWRDFFGPLLRDPNQINPQPRIGSGSGVFINSNGYIITNNHVIDNAEEIEVTLNDNRTFSARVIGTDPQTDLALIKIDQTNVPYLSLVNSDDVEVGEWVLAVGNPFNLTSTVTAGIVSAKGRSINILSDSLAIESFIQTDAAVNPGNSGGALVNLNGDLIGINTAIASTTGSFAGYAFAVPANIVTKIVEDLMTYGVVQRGLLGVKINNINNEFAREKDLKVSRGAYVNEVLDNTAAKSVGIREGDVITMIDGQIIRTSADLIGIIGSKRPGDKVNVTVNRSGREHSYEVTLLNSRGTVSLDKKEKVEFLTVLGAEIENVDRETLNRMGLKNGVRVRKLMAGKIRKSTNMREGFIITKIDGKAVSSKEDVVRMLENKSGGILIEGKYEGETETLYYGLGL